MAGVAGGFRGTKEKALFGAAFALLILVAVWVIGWEPSELELPKEPRVPQPEPAGAAAEVDKLYSSGRLEDYWDESARHVFVQPAPVRVFNPVTLEIPTLAPPRPPTTLPEPGPFLQNTGSLPRLGDSAALAAPAPSTGGVQ